MLNDLSIALASFAAFCYAAYLGLLMQRKHFGPSWNKMYDTNANKTCLRFVSVMILSIPVFIGFTFKLSIGKWQRLALRTVLLFLLGFIFFYFSHYVYLRFDLINPKIAYDKKEPLLEEDEDDYEDGRHEEHKNK